MSQASLIVVGSGIKFISHLTNECKAYIEQSDRVLYLVNDPAMKEWIKKCNRRSESLDELYTQYPIRQDSYSAITKYILKHVRQGLHVCVVLYGHPSVLAKPGLDAVRQARIEGYFAKILPGISAEDCLFADLLIDPGSCGCQSFEATDFLVHKRTFDTSCHLILWQIDAIGILDNFSSSNKHVIIYLTNYLRQFYSSDHEIIIYEAAQYPGFEPRIEKVMLCLLSEISLTRISTLYIPPYRSVVYDKTVLKELNIDILDLNYSKK